MISRLIFFRWRSWVLVEGRRDSFAKKHDPIFEGVKQMAETANIISSNTNLIGMDAWIGQFLLERTCNRWAEALIPTEDILGTRDASVVYDEIQFSGGSTFGLKGVIKLPNEDFEGDNMARLDMMMRDTRLMVYTLERVDAPVKTPTRGVIEFGSPVNGLCWMVGEEGVGTHSALELYPMVQNQSSMIIGLESAERSHG